MTELLLIYLRRAESRNNIKIQIGDASFAKKVQNFTKFEFSDNVQILLACGTNTYHRITNGISDFQCQHLQR